MKRKRFTEEQINQNPEGGRGRGKEAGNLPEARGLGADLLSMAVQVRRDAGVGGEEAEGARG